MATSANLPAGFSITTISGVRCTAVPKTATTVSGGKQTDAAKSTTKTEEASTTSTPTKESTTQAPPPPATTSTTAAAVVNTPAPAIISTSPAAPATSEQASPIPLSSTVAPPVVIATTPPPLAATTTSPPVAISSTFSTAISESPKSSAPGITATALPINTPASPASSSTITPSTSVLPVALSDTLPSSSAAAAAASSFQHTAGGSHTDGSNSDGSSLHSSTAAAAVAPSSLSGGTESSSSSESSLAGSETSGKSTQVGPIVGGVVGGLAGIALIAFLLLFFLRQRKRNRRSTLLTPLGTGRESRFYEIDRGSVGPTKRSEKWRAGAGLQVEKIGDVVSGVKDKIAILGSSLKTRVVGSRSDTPSVNLNRGQSQFLDGPIPQHSRSNSTASGSISRVTFRDRFEDWIERYREKFRGGSKESEDPYATARGMTEKQANMNGNPDFSQLLNMDDRELQLKAEQRRASLTAKTYQSGGGLGSLDFGSSLDPFADPTNPFADPVTQPKPSVSKQNNYVADVRRSRGLSTDMTNQANGTGIGTGAGGWRPPSSVPASRYPSTIAPSRDSYRDTVYSSFSSNVRKGKGRSDPFDLERPELWRSPPPMPEAPITRADTESIMISLERDSAVPPPLALNQPARVVSSEPPRHESTGTYASKYSSGISLGGFGDPGPDVGPGSSASSLRENGLHNYAEDLGRSGSVASSVSSKGGVGKAR